MTEPKKDKEKIAHVRQRAVVFGDVFQIVQRLDNATVGASADVTSLASAVLDDAEKRYTANRKKADVTNLAKKQINELHWAAWLKKVDEVRAQNPTLSDHAIHERVAKRFKVTTKTIYNAEKRRRVNS